MKSWNKATALVTGGASGIGLALVRGLVRRGVRVVIADVEMDALERAAAQLQGDGAAIVCRRTDVADFSSMQELAAFVAAEVGPLNLLFNNAGVSITGPIWKLTVNDWRWVLDVNVGGVINGIRAFLPAMLEHGRDAYIVNTASLAAFGGHGEHAPYCASKAAVLSISQSLYSEMRANLTRVGVSVVCPGMVATQIHESWRNRPEGDRPWSDRERDDPQHRALSQAVQAAGISADAVADAVFAGMSEGRFYIFTDRLADRFVRPLAEREIRAANPIVSTWGMDLRDPSEREWSPWSGALPGEET